MGRSLEPCFHRERSCLKTVSISKKSRSSVFPPMIGFIPVVVMVWSVTKLCESPLHSGIRTWNQSHTMSAVAARTGILRLGRTDRFGSCRGDQASRCASGRHVCRRGGLQGRGDVSLLVVRRWVLGNWTLPFGYVDAVHGIAFKATVNLLAQVLWRCRSQQLQTVFCGVTYFSLASFSGS